MNKILTKTIEAHRPWLEEQIASGALFFVGHSGGKDSQALAAVIESWVPADQIIYVHADLGDVEWANIQDHIRSGLPAGAELQVVQAFYKDGTPNRLVGRIEKRAEQLVEKGTIDSTSFWPSTGQRYCTGELKAKPIWKLIRNWPGCTKTKHQTKRPVVINCVGIRAEEGNRRKNLPPLSLNKDNDNTVREAWDFYPLHDVTIDRVWSLIEDSGQTRHWAYDNGNDRLSCLFCVFGSRNDWRNAKEIRPDLYDTFVGLETKYGRTLHQGRTIPEWLEEEGK